MNVPVAQKESQLATILFADVFGYSVLMEQYEEEVCDLTNVGISLFVELCRHYSGVVVEVVGDGLMIRFDGPDDAVNFAVAIQERLFETDLVLTNGEKILFRIGIHTGYVRIFAGGVRGHTVNVASRIESAVKPGAIGISEATFNHLSGKDDLDIHDVGYLPLKNISEPVRIFVVENFTKTVVVNRRSDGFSRNLDSPPTVVIGPIQIYPDNPQFESVAVALHEELIHQLSLRQEMRVSASGRFSGSEYRKDIALRLCRMTGIDYLIEGGFIVENDCYRVRIRLNCARSSLVLDSHAVDIRSTSLVSDLMLACKRICFRLVGKIVSAELSRVTAGVDSGQYLVYLQAKQQNKLLTESGNRQAQTMLRKILSKSGENSAALAELAHAQHMAWRYDWGENSSSMLQKSIKTAEAAVSMDPENATASSELAYALMFAGDREVSHRVFSRALELAPDDPWILADFAGYHTFTGNFDRSITMLRRSLTLNSTIDLDWRLWSLADAYFPLREYDEVVKTVSSMRNPTEGHRLAAASLGHLGRKKEASKYAKLVLQANPDFSVGRWVGIQPEEEPSEAEHYASGLRAAGLPR